MFSAFMLFLLLAAPRSNAQTAVQANAEQSRIMTLENAWNQAQQEKDAAALQMLLAPDLVYVDYDGALYNKSEYLASVQAPSLHPAHIVNESMSVHLYGSVAVVMGLCRETGIRNGKPYSVLTRFTDTWIRQANGWVCISSQSTLVPH